MKHTQTLILSALLFTVGCEKSAETYFDLSDKALADNQIEESISHLKDLLSHHENDSLSSKAQYLIGNIYMNNLRYFDTTINEYRKVIDNYAGSSQESEALFMIGYIYANILKDSAKAKNEYQTFLTRFPKHDLSPSVQFELDFLGKDIFEAPALKSINSY